jgi:hypothetical protein
MSRPSEDPRKVYILRIASHIFSLNLSEEKLPDRQSLDQFVDGSGQLLVISRSDKVSLQLYRTLST